MRCLLALAVAMSVVSAHSAMAESLADQVTIRRTEYGIPHILAESEEAAAFGFAWAQCEDHFPLMYKAMVRGRSEVSLRYGATESNIEYDLQTRQLRARKLAVDSYHLLPADYRSVIAGFAAGVNAYMAAHPEETEPWMTPVTAHDVISAWQLAVMRFTFLRGNIIGRFAEAMTKSDAALALPIAQDESFGSNAIALSPSRTASGRAMLLNNPHQPWSEEAHYYEAHVTVPGVYDFYGSTFIGGHMLTTGFNRYLGWAHTVNHPDLEEFYEVTLDPERPGQYLFDGGSVPFETETVVVEAAGQAPRSRESWWSPLGPVVYKTAEKAYILRSAGQGQYRTGLQWYRMAQAQNFAQFREALAMQALPMFNVIYADRDGNIMYLWNGTVPKLPHPSHRFEAVPAARTEEVWTAVHPIEDLMQLTNPRGGYVQNCNSPPYFTNLHAPLNRDDYPHYFSDNDLNLRTQHGLSLVHNAEIFTLEALAKAKFSTRFLLADRVKDDLLAALESADLRADERAAAKALRDWDNAADADSVGAVLFETWWNLYRRGDAVYAEPWSDDEPVATPRGLGSPDRAVTTFREAVGETAAQWGSWRVKWGDVHRLRRGKLDLPISGGSGDLGCFRVCDFAEGEDGKRVMSGGDGFVFVVEFGDAPKAYSVLAYSQSGRPDSPHYNDQARLFAKHAMKSVAFTEEEVAAQLLRSYRPGE